MFINYTVCYTYAYFCVWVELYVEFEIKGNKEVI